MKLYYLSQDVNSGYDTYDSAVVAAESVAAARLTHPGSIRAWDGRKQEFDAWCAAKDVKVEYLGKAKRDTKAGVICASYNAG